MWKALTGTALMAAIALSFGAGDAEAAKKKKSKPPVPFTAEMLDDQAMIDAGKVIWQEQCAHCHGSKAYPGKAPKLKPKRYKAGFVYRRATDGFRKMPSFKDVYNDEERMQVEVYIRSKQFSP